MQIKPTSEPQALSPAGATRGRRALASAALVALGGLTALLLASAAAAAPSQAAPIKPGVDLVWPLPPDPPRVQATSDR